MSGMWSFTVNDAVCVGVGTLLLGLNDPVHGVKRA